MKRLSFGLIFWVLVLVGCEAFSSAVPEKEQFSVVVWNVHNLFDGEDNGNEYREFRQAAGWTAEKYQARLTAISRLIPQKSESSLPGLIGLVEVENAGVLNDLASGPLSRHGYSWFAFTRLPGSAIGLGILSRFPITDARSHSITIGEASAPRPILEVRVEPRGEPVVFMLCHWKSKLGGADETEALRRSSARVVQRRLGEIKESEPDTPVIVMGDMNVNHDEFYRRSGSIRYALLPDNPDAAVLAVSAFDELFGAQDFLVLSGEKPPLPRYFPQETHVLFSPWIDEKSGGSYFFRGSWETIDHFLLSAALFSGQGWDYAGAYVLKREPYITSEGIPNRYIPRSGRGLSDHLPLLLYLRYFE